jgi:hypothetical protein
MDNLQLYYTFRIKTITVAKDHLRDYLGINVVMKKMTEIRLYMSQQGSSALAAEHSKVMQVTSSPDVSMRALSIPKRTR